MERVSFKNMVLRTLCMMVAMTLFCFGMTLFLAGGLGSAAVTTLQQALFDNWGIPYTVSNIAINGVVLAVFLLFDRQYFHVGTAVTLVWPGMVMDVARHLLAPLFQMQFSFPAALGLTLAGAVICAVGMSLFFPTSVGIGAQDMLVLTLQEKCKLSFKVAYYTVNGAFLVVGIALGGKWGLGTVISLFVIGFLAETFMQVTRVPLYKFTRQFDRLGREYPEGDHRGGLQEGVPANEKT